MGDVSPPQSAFRLEAGAPPAIGSPPAPWGWSPTSCFHTQRSGPSRLLAVPLLIPGPLNMVPVPLRGRHLTPCLCGERPVKHSLHFVTEGTYEYDLSSKPKRASESAIQTILVFAITPGQQA